MNGDGAHGQSEGCAESAEGYREVNGVRGSFADYSPSVGLQPLTWSPPGLAGGFQPSQLQRQIWFRLSASSKSSQMSGGKLSSPSFIRFIAIRLAVLTRA